MKRLLSDKLGGLESSMRRFRDTVMDFELTKDKLVPFADIIRMQMEQLDFDEVRKDPYGNVIGTVRGFRKKGDLMLISHMDFPSPEPAYNWGTARPDQQSFGHLKNGIISSIFAGALLKRSLLPMDGDLIVCCAPRADAYAYDVRQVFYDLMKTEKTELKGVVLAEPTDLNLHLGHKGRFEYEIVIRGRVPKAMLKNGKEDIPGAIAPLLEELEKVSRHLPQNSILGPSQLTVKDVRYYEPEQGNYDEFHVVVDREFVPEENCSSIIERAQSIAENAWQHASGGSARTGGPSVTVSARPSSGVSVLSRKESKPFMMDGHHPFVLDSLGTLKDNGFSPSVGYWQHSNTVGAYTYGELKIPTIGFGAGNEDASSGKGENVSLEQLKKAVFGTTMIVHRNIGVPTFGWSSDDY